jgi:hypothetical protein
MAPLAASELISSRLTATVTDAVAVAAQVRVHPDVRSLYPDLLRELHGTVRASVPLLETAAREARRLAAAGDAVADGLVDYYRRHVAEELHHDDWLLEDYRALGRDPSEILTAPPSQPVAVMVGPIYYWVLHFHPVALLGYLVVTEGAPPTLDLVEDLQRRTGFPTRSFHTLRHHAVVDLDHGDDVWDLVDALPLSDEQLDVIELAAVHTARAQVALLTDLLAPRARRSPRH